MSRALVAVLHFDFNSALTFHPLIFIMPFAVMVYFLRFKLSTKMFAAIMSGFLVLLIIVYVVRIFNNDPIIQFDFKNGALFRFFEKII